MEGLPAFRQGVPNRRLVEGGTLASAISLCVEDATPMVSLGTNQMPDHLGLQIGDIADVYLYSNLRDDDDSINGSEEPLQKSWEVEDEGDISDLLGVQIDRGKDQVTMTQTAYIDRMMSTWCPDGIPKENLTEATKTPSDEDLPQLVADAMFAREERPRGSS